MAITTYVYRGEAYWSETRRAEEGEMDEAILKIHSLYDAGTPFFTKEALQGVSNQLEKHSVKGQKVFVRGLDGTIVDFEVENGLILPSGEDDSEMVLRSPFISYVPIQDLTSNTENNIPRLAYCNLRIHHYMDKRNKLTKQIITSPSYQPREEIENWFKTLRCEWEASKSCRQLHSLFTSISIPSQISKIVGFACGTLLSSCQEQAADRVVFQHALILTLRDIVTNKQVESDPIRCHAQDPAYTEIDNSVLEGHGITVLKDPKGFLEVDDSTVVVSCAAAIPVKQIVSDLARPAVIVWDRVSEDEPEQLFLDPDSPRLRKEIHKFYDRFDFPEDLDHFGDVAIYVRRKAARLSGIHD